MTQGSGLPRAVLQRSLADWPVVLAAWILLVCATTLLATGVVYGDAVASSGLHRSILAAPPATRTVQVSTSSDVAGIDGLDGVIRPAIRAAIAASGGEIARVTRSGSYADPAVASGDVRDLTVFESLDGIERHATLTAGAWPHAGSDPLEATLSEPAAAALGLGLGDRLSLANRADAQQRVEVVIAGIWRPDPSDAFWLGDPLETTGTTTEGTFTTRGPIVLREADLVSLGGGRGRVEVSWRGLPDIPALRIDQVESLRSGVDGLATSLRRQLPSGVTPRVTTTMPALLDEVGRSVLVSRSGVILLTIQFAVLAGYSIVLVAGMLVERRRSEIALLRSRGASAGHLVLMSVLEATALAIPAVIVAPWLALGVVALLGTFGPAAGLGITGSASLGASAYVVSALAGLACIVALAVPTIGVAASPAGARAAEGRQSRTTLPQRLGLDLALVAVAAVALWQLRLYGAPITRNARGTLGLDPLLVAAPAIGLLGGAVLALRIVPRIAELGERLLVRGRGMVGSLGGRQLARRPLRYTRTALLLMLAAALGTLAAANAATWTRSQGDQATYQAAADVRVLSSTGSTQPSWATGPLYRSIPGVAQAAPVAVAPFNLGRTIPDGRIVGLNAETVGGVLSPEVATSGSPTEASLLATLASSRPTTASLPLPDDTTQLAMTIDPSFSGLIYTESEPIKAVLTPGSGSVTVTAVLSDGDGRVFRTASAAGSLTAAHQRLVVPIVDPADASGNPGLRPAGPLRLDAIELLVGVSDEVAVIGSVELVSVEIASDPAGGGGWTVLPVDPRAPGWQWRQIDRNGDVTVATPVARPGRVTISDQQPIFGGAFSDSSTTFRLGAALPEDVAVPAIASASFLVRTGSAVGDSLNVTTLGVPLKIRIIGTADQFAPLDPELPFLVVDLATYDQLQFASSGATRQADEWWLRVDPGQAPAVLDRLRQPSAGARAVIGRDELAASLSNDPVPLGLIGVLGLGSLAAMLFAGIGFLVSSTVSTSERLAEFALLRALGLSAGQLALWLSIESVFLLAIGLMAGSALGLVLAFLVLPFATLTQTGAAAIPAPVVVIPWVSIVPVYLAGVVMFVLSVWLVRRQLPDVRISGVLRAGQG